MEKNTEMAQNVKSRATETKNNTPKSITESVN